MSDPFEDVDRLLAGERVERDPEEVIAALLGALRELRTLREQVERASFLADVLSDLPPEHTWTWDESTLLGELRSVLHGDLTPMSEDAAEAIERAKLQIRVAEGIYAAGTVAVQAGVASGAGGGGSSRTLRELLRQHQFPRVVEKIGKDE